MRKKREILATAARLATDLSSVSGGEVVKEDGTKVDVIPYAHGAGVALGTIVMYACGDEVPTIEEILKMSVAWTEEHADSHEGSDEREGEADHE